MNIVFKRILYILLGLVVIFIIVYPKINWESKQSVTPTSGTTASKSLTVDARIMKPERLDYSVKVTGNIIADESIEINSEVSAKVQTIHFKEGQEVKKGQLLVSLNDDELKAELEKLKLTKKRSEDNEFRQRRLMEREAISQDEYEIALTTLNTSLAEIKLLEVRMAKYRIYAPFDGIVGLREISEGSYINTGTLIARLYRIDPVKIDFNVPGRYINDVDKGDELYFTVDASDRVFKGIIYAIEPRIDPQTRSIKIRAISRNPDGKLLPGQFAKISLVLEKIENALMIPSESIVPELNAMRVFVYKSGKVEGRVIETGIRTENQVQVISGLVPGDTVITTGMLQIRQGMDVNIKL